MLQYGMRCVECGGYINYRRNPDEETRGSERESISEPTVMNLLATQHKRYRSGLPGIGRSKLEAWWEEALEPDSIIGEERDGSPRPPVHPHSLISPDEPLFHVLFGYFRGYQVSVSHYFEHLHLHKPLTTLMEIVVATGGGSTFPSGRKIIAYLLDSDTLSMVHPRDVEGLDYNTRWKVQHHLPHEPWSPDELQINHYKSLLEILLRMAEDLFLYDHRDRLVDDAADLVNRECGNCHQMRQIYVRFGHRYYNCDQCRGVPII